MRRLYQAADRFEAQRLIDLLQDHDIPAVMLGDYLSGAAGELPATIFPCVWVIDNGHWLRARGLLREFRAPPSEPGEAWQCPRCGEAVEGVFDVCWNCATQRPPE